MIHIDKENRRVVFTRYLLMDERVEVHWYQYTDKKGTILGEGWFMQKATHPKKGYGAGILRRMRDRQVEREKRAKKPPFNKKEIKIIRTLYSFQTPLTTGKVTKYAGFSYNTTRKYLRRLAEKNYVKHVHHGNAVYWWLREREKGEE